MNQPTVWLELETEHLVFRPTAPGDLLALIESEDSFEASTGYVAAAGLREFFVGGEISPEFVASLRDATGPNPWYWGFIVIQKETGLAIGTAGFKGEANDAGVVEIAYGIVPSFENRGYATLAAQTLVNFALVERNVKSIIAHTLPEANASTRVLQKSGFEKTGSFDDPDDGLVWRWTYQLAKADND